VLTGILRRAANRADPGRVAFSAIACYDVGQMLLKVKQYAKHVGKDKADVYRAIRDGRLKVTRPPKEHPNYAMLIDSNQLWPEQRQARKLTSGQAGQSPARPPAGVARQADKTDDKTSPNGWWEVVVVVISIYLIRGLCAKKGGSQVAGSSWWGRGGR